MEDDAIVIKISDLLAQSVQKFPVETTYDMRNERHLIKLNKEFLRSLLMTVEDDVLNELGTLVLNELDRRK
jgi:hypothetical protein